MAMIAAGFTGGEAEELRRAMGFKRSEKRMKAIEARLRAGMARERHHGRGRRTTIVRSITSFALYGFPESHAASFALHRLRERVPEGAPPGGVRLRAAQQPADGLLPPVHAGEGRAAPRRALPAGRRDAERLALRAGGRASVRLGLRYVRGPARGGGRAHRGGARASGRSRSLQDFVDRTGRQRDELRRLAEVGALNAFGLTRRERALAGGEGGTPARAAVRATARAGDDASPLPEMTRAERLHERPRAAPASRVGPHPMSFYRQALVERGVTPRRRPAAPRATAAACASPAP